jgi:polyphosphate kinase
VAIDLIVRGICCCARVCRLVADPRDLDRRSLPRARPHLLLREWRAAGIPAGLRRLDARNLDRRVEIAFPVLDPDLQTRIREILEIQLADTVKARRIRRRELERMPPSGERALRSQQKLYDHRREEWARRAAHRRQTPRCIARRGRPRTVAREEGAA